MTLQQLSYLIKVAECGNITEAAEQLYISQPSLSTAISNLEKEMGVTAFIIIIESFFILKDIGLNNLVPIVCYFQINIDNS